jgi:hypothetical protein
MKMRAVVLLLWCAQMAVVCAGAGGDYDPRDGLAPKTAKDDALALPLATATIATTSLEETVLFYCDGMGLTLEGPIEQSAADQAAQKALWGVEEEVGWKLYRLHRPATAGEITIRLLVLDRPMPSILSSWEPRQSGPFSLGFPTADAEKVDQHLRDLGFGARNELEKYTIPRTDGTEYPIHETIFNAPDFVHAVNIYRGGGMAPLGPIDPETGRGGPGYSAWVARDSHWSCAPTTTFRPDRPTERCATSRERSSGSRSSSQKATGRADTCWSSTSGTARSTRRTPSLVFRTAASGCGHSR